MILPASTPVASRRRTKTRGKATPVGYFQPGSIREALDILGAERPRVVAGCTDFYPSQPMGGRTRTILDLTRVDGLRGISATEDGWRIGATTTWTDIDRADLPPAFDALKQAARTVGAVQIQNAGTIAGNLCNASPAADGVPPLLALDVVVEVASAAGSRRMALADFITGVRRTALAPGEMVTALHVPRAAGDGGSAFEKLGSRRHLVISIAMVAANVRVADGRIAALRVAVGACSPVAMRMREMEAALAGARVGEVTMRAEWFEGLSPLTDIRGTAEYRREAVAALCARAIRRAAGREG